MASLLPFARHRVPLPWHAVVEYGFLASDLSRLRAAFKKHGLECNVRRGILKCWFGDGAKLRSVYGNRLLTSFRAQTWPWADLFPHEAGRGGCGGGLLGSALSPTPGAPKRTKRLAASGTAWPPSTSGSTGSARSGSTPTGRKGSAAPGCCARPGRRPSCVARSDRVLTETADHPHLKIEAGGAGSEVGGCR